jgi:hypothetical protein
MAVILVGRQLNGWRARSVFDGGARDHDAWDLASRAERSENGFV